VSSGKREAGAVKGRGWTFFKKVRDGEVKSELKNHRPWLQDLPADLTGGQKKNLALLPRGGLKEGLKVDGR